MNPAHVIQGPAPILSMKELDHREGICSNPIIYKCAKPGILIADDDVSVRTLLGDELRSRGFAVWDAADGRRALEVYRAFGPVITVVLLAVNMPETDGPRTMIELQKINPFVRCIFLTSGDNGKYLMGDLTQLGAEIVFQKPFEAETTADMLWNMVADDA